MSTQDPNQFLDWFSKNQNMFSDLGNNADDFSENMDIMNFNDAAQLTIAQKWAIACTCNVSLTNGEFLDSLETASKDVLEYTQDLLSDWWSITNKSELLARIEKLKEKGVREFYKDALKASIDIENGKEGAEEALIEKYEGSEFDEVDVLDRIEDASMRHEYTDDKPYNPFKRFNINTPNFLAWDYCRIISLCRWGYGADYLTEQEAWGIIMPIAKELQKTYSSWEDMNDSYKVAKLIWNADSFNEQYADDSNLYTHEKSPFKTIPWNTPLN